MNSKIVNFVCSKGLKFEKNNYFGMLDGVQINGYAPAVESATVTFTAYVPVESANTLVYWLESNKRRYGIINYSVHMSGVSAVFSPYVMVAKYLQYFDDFFPVFRQNCIIGRCPLCGEDMMASAYVEINGLRLHVHESCFESQINRAGAAGTNSDKRAAGIVRGVLGATVGSLAGCIVWAILYLFGFVAGIASILTVICAAVLWDKFGGRGYRAKIISVWTITFALLFITMFFTYLISIRIGLDQNNLAGSSLEWLVELIKRDEEFRWEMIYDIVISSVFTIFGNILVTLRTLRAGRAARNVFKRLDA